MENSDYPVTAVRPSAVAGRRDHGGGHLTGTNLTIIQSVTFDGVDAPFSMANDTMLSVVTPPGAAGAVDVVVRTSRGIATVTGGFTLRDRSR